MSLQVSETLVLNHGDFLIRDSQSSPGDFVLTCRWEQKTLHFLIWKTAVLSAEQYTQVRYGLEGEAFDSLPALVHYHVGSRVALTQSSGAQIHRPANRMLPIRFLEATFCTAVGPHPHPRGLKSGVKGGERVRPSRYCVTPVEFQVTLLFHVNPVLVASCEDFVFFTCIYETLCDSHRPELYMKEKKINLTHS